MSRAFVSRLTQIRHTFHLLLGVMEDDFMQLKILSVLHFPEPMSDLVHFW